MADENIKTTLQFKADIADFKAAMSEARNAVKLANSEFKEAASGMDDWGNSADGLKAKVNQLAKVEEAQKRQLDVLNEAYKKVVKEQGEASDEAIKLKTQINNQQAAINKTAKEHQEFAEKLEKVESGAAEAEQKLEELEKAARESGEGFTVMKGALAELVADGIRALIEGAKDLAVNIVNMGKDFSSTMSEVKAISGATDEEFQMLKDTAREWGSKTVFSATEAAEAMKYMAMAGWTVEQSVDGLPGILNLAASSGTDLGTASDIVTDALTAMGYAAGDAAQLADVMAAASSSANTNVEMMGETFKYAGPLIGAMGYSMEDAALSIGLMANAGIKGSQAGTALRSIITRLSTAPTDAVANTMAEFGISLTDSTGAMKPFREVMEDLRESLRGADPEVQTYVASTLAGQEAMSGLLAIVNASDEDFNKLAASIDGSAGSAQKMADTMNDNLGGDLAEMSSALEELGLTIYDKLEEPLRSVVQWITENLNPAFNWIVENGPVIAGIIGSITAGFIAAKAAMALTAVIQGFQIFFGVLKTGQGVWAALNAVMNLNPIGLIVTAIGLLVTAFVTLWNNCEGFRNFWINLWEEIKEITSKAWNGLKKIFTTIIDFVKNNWQSLLLLLVNPFAGAFKLLYDNCDGFREFIDKFLDKLKTMFKSGLDAIVNFFTKTIPNLVSNVAKWFGELPGKIGSAISGALQTVVTWGKNLVAKGKEAASNLVSAVVNGVASLPGKMLDAGKNLVSGLWEGISGSFTWIKNKISGWVGNVTSFIKNLFGIHSPSAVMRDEVGKMLGLGMAEGIEQSRSAVNSAVRDLGNAAMSGLSGSMQATAGGYAGGGGKTIIINQTNNSPRALSRLEIYRQTHNALAYAGGV